MVALTIGLAAPAMAQEPPPPPPGQAGPPPGPPSAPLSPQQLQQLVAPIALYPDSLVGQILAAATYPTQIVEAERFLEQNPGLTGEALANAVNEQDWDPSVKALTAFPSVLSDMNQNLSWVSELGDANYNQPEDVMNAIQYMRQQAQRAGNLQSTPQEPLVYDQGYIQLEPPSQQVVYVPTYDPWTVYGQPVAPYPGFSLLGALGSGIGAFFSSGYGGSAIQYGLGIALSAFSHTPWGFFGWGLNWLAHAVLFHQSNYFTHSTTVADWGLPHGGPRAYYGGAVAARAPDRYFGGVHSAPGFRSGQNFVQPAREFYGGRGDEQVNPDYREPNYRQPGYQEPRNGYVRPALPQQQAYNRAQPYAGQTYRGQTDPYGRSSYGYDSRPTQSYAARPGAAYASPYQTYRAPAQNYERGNESAQRSYNAYGDSYAKQQRSGSFHLFGNGRDSNRVAEARAPKSYYGSYREPKNFGREKMPKMPKEHAPKYHSSGHRSSSHHR